MISISLLPVESCAYQHYGPLVRLIPLAGISGTILSNEFERRFVVALPGLQYSFAVLNRPKWPP